MKATLDASPSPNQTRNNGRNASGGIGRTSSMIGSSISRTGTQSAANSPRPSAATAASPSVRELDREDLLDPPGRRGQDHDAIGEVDGLTNRVGDEQHGLVLDALDAAE